MTRKEKADSNGSSAHVVQSHLICSQSIKHHTTANSCNTFLRSLHFTYSDTNHLPYSQKANPTKRKPNSITDLHKKECSHTITANRPVIPLQAEEIITNKTGTLRPHFPRSDSNHFGKPKARFNFIFTPAVRRYAETFIGGFHQARTKHKLSTDAPQPMSLFFKNNARMFILFVFFFSFFGQCSCVSQLGLFNLNSWLVWSRLASFFGSYTLHFCIQTTRMSDSIRNPVLQTVNLTNLLPVTVSKRFQNDLLTLPAI